MWFGIDYLLLFSQKIISVRVVLKKETVLLEKAKNGDVASLNEILDKYKDQAFSLAIRIVKNESHAQDIVQNAFIKIFKSIHQFKSESRFTTWLYRIIYNEALQYLQKETKYNAIDEISEVEEMDFAVIDDSFRNIVDDERKRIIDKALNELNHQENTILTLFYLEEKSIREIQEITGLKKSNIKVILHRARKKLQIILSQMLKEEVTSLL